MIYTNTAIHNMNVAIGVKGAHPKELINDNVNTPVNTQTRTGNNFKEIIFMAL